MNFILRFFYCRIISEFLNLQMNALEVYKAQSNSLLARILNLRDNTFANISENKVNISEFTVFI